MNNSRRLVCLIVAVLGFTFFPGLAQSKGATGPTGLHHNFTQGFDFEDSGT